MTGNRTGDIRFTNFTNPFVLAMYAIAFLGFLFLVKLDVDLIHQALKDGSWMDLFIWTVYFCLIGAPYVLAEYLDYKFPLDPVKKKSEPKDHGG